MKPLQILLLLTIFALMMVSGILEVKLSREHEQRIRLENRLAASEEKLNTQAAQIESQAGKFTTQTQGLMASKGAEMTEQLAEDKQAARVAVAGIYKFEPLYSGRIEVRDFRSDGSGVSYRYFGNSREPYGSQNFGWLMTGASVSIIFPPASFHTEGVDLIDTQGNRWIRTR